ncbi:isohomocitrate dehydrogenase AksF [Methanobrevibacter ruminantium M1]|uniref:Isohomocitrate dehydrogenase AksF n=1 Tax=Methanobrevibacter ruminantium (strain ATCC 35063 / DSM 1093 / JCM 13430 / OCM 146 / M1) TaxID=634498 RepID=D3E2X3_METRM|nr:homoisocitrate dehydrogenase [Methanobrevibacter ruminantium]ADC46884.1 isohomocitrate dehydrogenase AksF [Methanobrevibacter ruminantium M1]
MIKIARIDGDGIGKEVTEAGVAVLESLDLNIDFVEAEAGRECFDKNGTTIPEETIRIARNAKATLFGAITSTPGEKSPIITLRQELDTYANLRPIKSFKGVDCLFDDLDFLIVRENTEGLYSGKERLEEDKAIAHRVITRKASERISRLAFQEAIKLNKESVTCVHKSNVLKKTDGVFKDSFYNVAKDYPQIKTIDYYVDATAMYLLTKPQEFDVIVTSNLFGDILSDASAGLVGGLGLAPSGNIGDKHGLFEPVHGSAPDIAGNNISNPIAMILSVSMMLEYLNEDYLASKVKTACENVLEKGKVLTPDLGGNAKTMDVANEVIKEIEKLD